MRRMRMLRTQRGAPKGHTVETFHAGEEYDLPDSLADAFEANGAAEPVKVAEETQPEDKMVRPAEEEQGEPVETPKRRKTTRPKPSDNEDSTGE